MENTTHSIKRKKRRTRKCLDELRNRSRRNVDDRGNSFEKSSQQLSKAISSETITRPALAEIKQQRNVNLVMREKVRASNISTLAFNQESICNTVNDVPETNFVENPTYKDSNTIHDYDDAKSSSSFALFSPTSPANKPITVSKLLNEEDPETSTVTTPSSQISHGEYRHHLYEEFMNEIPSYFKQLTSSIIREDGIQNTINHLQKLYVASCQKEYEENIWKCINGRKSMNTSGQSEVMVENALDYIRVRSEPASPPLCATPDYNYYPHRLN